MRSVLLLAAQLAPESADLRHTLLSGDRHLPALSRLLSRARLKRHCAEHVQAWLCNAFAVPAPDGEWPLAALTLLADGHAPDSAFWLRADPVHLQARDADLELASSSGLEVRQAEAATLVEALDRHFALDGLAFLAPTPKRWYVRTAQPARVQTTPVDRAVGRGVAALLPRGPDALAWHRRVNEAQMLLHAHPANAAREEAGAPSVNSIWFWGGGVLPTPPAHPTALVAQASVWADDPLARGLALHTGRPLWPLPADGTTWLERATEGRHLVVLEPPGEHASPDDGARAARQLDAAWLAPLLHALSRGRLHDLTLVVAHARTALHFTLTRADLWKLWRRGHDLARA